MSALTAPFFSILPLSFLRHCDAAAITNSSIVDEPGVDRALSISLVYGLVLFYVAVVAFFIVRHVRRGLRFERGFVATVANGNIGQGGDYPLSVAVSGPSLHKEDAFALRDSPYTTISGINSLNDRDEAAGVQGTAAQKFARDWRDSVDIAIQGNVVAASSKQDEFVDAPQLDGINGESHTIIRSADADPEVRSFLDLPEAPSSLPIHENHFSPPEVGETSRADTVVPDPDDAEGDRQINHYTYPPSNTFAPEAPGPANHERQSPDTTDTTPGSHFLLPVAVEGPSSNNASLHSDTASQDLQTASHAAVPGTSAPETPGLAHHERQSPDTTDANPGSYLPLPVVVEAPSSDSAVPDSDTASQDWKTAWNTATPELADAPTEDGNLADRNADDQAESDGGSLSSNTDTRDPSPLPDSPFAHKSTPTDSKRSSRSVDVTQPNTALSDAPSTHPIDSRRSSRSHDIPEPNIALSYAPFTHSSTRTDSKRSSRSENGAQRNTASQDSKIASRVATPEPASPSEHSTHFESLREGDSSNHTDDDAFLSSKTDTSEYSPSRSPSVAPSPPPWESGNPDGGNGVPNYTEDDEASLSSEPDLSESSASGTSASPTNLPSPSDVSESGPSAVHSSRSSDANVNAASQDHAQLWEEVNAGDCKVEHTDGDGLSLLPHNIDTGEKRSSSSDTSLASATGLKTSSVFDRFSTTISSPSDINSSLFSQGEEWLDRSDQARVAGTALLSDRFSTTISSPSDISHSTSSRGEGLLDGSDSFSHSSRPYDVNRDGHTIREDRSLADLSEAPSSPSQLTETSHGSHSPPPMLVKAASPDPALLDVDMDQQVTVPNAPIPVPWTHRERQDQPDPPPSVRSAIKNPPVVFTAPYTLDSPSLYAESASDESRSLVGVAQPAPLSSDESQSSSPSADVTKSPPGSERSESLLSTLESSSFLLDAHHNGKILFAHPFEPTAELLPSDTAALESGVEDVEVGPGSSLSEVAEWKANNKIQSPTTFVGTSSSLLESTPLGPGHFDGAREVERDKHGSQSAVDAPLVEGENPETLNVPEAANTSPSRVTFIDYAPAEGAQSQSVSPSDVGISERRGYGDEFVVSNDANGRTASDTPVSSLSHTPELDDESRYQEDNETTEPMLINDRTFDIWAWRALQGLPSDTGATEQLPLQVVQGSYAGNETPPMEILSSFPVLAEAQHSPTNYYDHPSDLAAEPFLLLLDTGARSRRTSLSSESDDVNQGHGQSDTLSEFTSYYFPPLNDARQDTPLPDSPPPAYSREVPLSRLAIPEHAQTFNNTHQHIVPRPPTGDLDAPSNPGQGRGHVTMQAADGRMLANVGQMEYPDQPSPPPPHMDNVYDAERPLPMGHGDADGQTGNPRQPLRPLHEDFEEGMNVNPFPQVANGAGVTNNPEPSNSGHRDQVVRREGYNANQSQAFENATHHPRLPAIPYANNFGHQNRGAILFPPNHSPSESQSSHHSLLPDDLNAMNTLGHGHTPAEGPLMGFTSPPFPNGERIQHNENLGQHTLGARPFSPDHSLSESQISSPDLPHRSSFQDNGNAAGNPSQPLSPYASNMRHNPAGAGSSGHVDLDEHLPANPSQMALTGVSPLANGAAWQRTQHDESEMLLPERPRSLVTYLDYGSEHGTHPSMNQGFSPSDTVSQPDRSSPVTNNVRPESLREGTSSGGFSPVDADARSDFDRAAAGPSFSPGSNPRQHQASPLSGSPRSLSLPNDAHRLPPSEVVTDWQTAQAADTDFETASLSDPESCQFRPESPSRSSVTRMNYGSETSAAMAGGSPPPGDTNWQENNPNMNQGFSPSDAMSQSDGSLPVTNDLHPNSLRDGAGIPPSGGYPPPGDVDATRTLPIDGARPQVYFPGGSPLPDNTNWQRSQSDVFPPPEHLRSPATSIDGSETAEYDANGHGNQPPMNLGFSSSDAMSQSHRSLLVPNDGRQNPVWQDAGSPFSGGFSPPVGVNNDVDQVDNDGDQAAVGVPFSAGYDPSQYPAHSPSGSPRSLAFPDEVNADWQPDFETAPSSDTESSHVLPEFPLADGTVDLESPRSSFADLYRTNNSSQASLVEAAADLESPRSPLSDVYKASDTSQSSLADAAADIEAPRSPWSDVYRTGSTSPSLLADDDAGDRSSLVDAYRANNSNQFSLVDVAETASLLSDDSSQSDIFDVARRTSLWTAFITLSAVPSMVTTVLQSLSVQSRLVVDRALSVSATALLFLYFALAVPILQHSMLNPDEERVSCPESRTATWHFFWHLLARYQISKSSPQFDALPALILGLQDASVASVAGCLGETWGSLFWRQKMLIAAPAAIFYAYLDIIPVVIKLWVTFRNRRAC
ncbi:hypothetical protein C8R47DRAFT_1252569 [Mycena vitilis]|nr:hypothetical protein C8R47DRAFT_1252569 [Mycena vitilis]